MPRYKVALSYRVKFYREAEVEVEAEDEDEAQWVAYGLAENGEIDWEESSEDHDSVICHPPELIADAYDECCAGMADCPCLHAPGAR